MHIEWRSFFFCTIISSSKKLWDKSSGACTFAKYLFYTRAPLHRTIEFSARVIHWVINATCIESTLYHTVASQSLRWHLDFFSQSHRSRGAEKDAAWKLLGKGMRLSDETFSSFHILLFIVVERKIYNLKKAETHHGPRFHINDKCHVFTSSEISLISH